jgi:DNA-binding protein HU-beta
MLNKADMIKAVAAKTGETQTVVVSVMDALTELTASQLQAGATVSLPGIARLIPKHKAARAGRNPATGDAVQIPAKIAVVAKISKAITDALN